MSEPAVATQFVHVNSMRLHLYVAGPENGPLLIFLHGFPDFGGAWHRQLAYFGARGYRVIAPDQRGYGDSDKPPNVAAYRIDKLAGDIAGLADALGHDRFDLVAHDWGGVVAWHLLEHYPQRIRRAVIMNAPELGVLGRVARRSLNQLAKGKYILFFQLPRLPEAVIGSHGGNRLLHASGLSAVLDKPDRARYRQAWDGALTSMLNWYRAALRSGSGGKADSRQPIDTPLLILWSKQDHYLVPELAEQCATLCSNARLEYLEGVGHWLYHEQPEAINARIEDFLTTT